MIKHLTFLCIFLILAAPAVINAQDSVSGTVVDQQSREAIMGATIVIKGTGISTSTNDYGKFTITSKNEIKTLLVSRLGYLKKEVNVGTAEKPLYIELTPSPVLLSGVQVIGSSQLLSAQSIGTLTPHDLERANGLSLENSLNTIPGVFMQSRTPWGGAHITIRGYYPSTSRNSPNSNGLGYQVFLNNIPITDATGSTILDDIDFSTLGNVEVIKGPSSSLYGSYIGGTVLLKTERPKPNQSSIEQQAIGGSNGLFRSNTTWQNSESNSDLVINYGHQTYKSFRPHSASWKDYARVTGDYQAGNNHLLSVYFSYNRSFEELAGEIDSADFYNRLPISNDLYIANDSHIQLESFRLGVTDDIRFNEFFTNQTTVFGSGRSSNQPFAHGFTDVNQFNFGARTAFNYKRQGTTVGIDGTLGGMFQKSNLTSNGVFIVPAPPFPQRPSDQENYALNYYLFTEWSLLLPNHFIVTAGASLNKNEFGVRNMLKNNQVNDTTDVIVDAFKPVITPRISVTKIFSNEFSVYASVSTGYTPPLLGDAVASDNSVNQDLKPEKAIQYEIGTKGNLFDQSLSYQISVFDLENTNKLVSQTSNSVTYTTNAGKQQNRGAEISVSYLAVDNPEQTISLFRPWVTYTYSNFKYKDFKSDNNNTASTVDFSGNKVPRVPENVFNVGLDLGTNFGLYLYGSYQYVGKAPITFDNSNFMKSYNLLSAKIGYKRQFGEHVSLDLFAGGDNLLSSTYYTFLFIGPNIQGLAQSKDGGHGDGYIIPGPYKATFYGNLTFSYIF